MSEVLRQLHWLPVKKGSNPISPITVYALRRHTCVPRFAAASSYATPLPTLCRRSTSARPTCQHRTLRSTSVCLLWSDTLMNTGNRAQFEKDIKDFFETNLCFIPCSVYICYLLKHNFFHGFCDCIYYAKL